MSSPFRFHRVVRLLPLLAALAAAPVQRAEETPAGEPSLAALRERATAGEASAQYFLGLRYSHGVDVARDDAEAARWFARAAAQGDAAAARSLAPLLRDGGGLPRDPAAARAWLREFAPRLPAAAAKLGELLLTDEGGAADPIAAEQLIRGAAAANDPAGVYLLSQLLEQGVGGPADPAGARAALEKAADLHEPRAALQLALALLATTPADAAATERAVKLLREDSVQQMPAGRHALARLLEDGRGVAADPVKAAQLHRESAEGGYAPAQVSFARLLLLGTGVARDPDAAVRWLREAAAHDDAAAHFNLGLLAETGVGLPRDAAAAAASFATSARLGYAPAQWRYAQALRDGRGVKADARAAETWAALAADSVKEADDFLSTLAPAARVDARRRALELRQTAAPAKPAAPLPSAAEARAAAKAAEALAARPPRVIGTGFAVHADGWIVTSCKTIAGATDVRVLVGGVPRTARVAARNERQDLALLKIEHAGLPVLPLRQAAARLGDDAAAVGLQDQLARPGDVLWMPTRIVLAGRVGDGELAGLDRFWPAQAAGGPLLDARGRVLGVLTQIAEQAVAPRGADASAFAGDLGCVAPTDLVRQLAAEAGVQLVLAEESAGGASREAVAAALLPVYVF